MAEENTETTQATETPATFTQEQVDAMIAEKTSGMQSHLDKLLGETKKAKAAREKAEEDAARKSGDVEALEKSWSDKLAAREAELTDGLAQREQLVNELTAGAAASKLASELAVPGSASVLEALIKQRVAAEIKDGQARVVVRDESGKPSASTMDDLRAELIANPALAPLLVGTKAKGGGAAGGDGSAGSKTIKRADFDALSQHLRAEFSKSGGKVVD